MSSFTASERLTRLLGVIPWVAANGGVRIDEVAHRFNYPRADLLADLNDVVLFVGVHPFTPDTMIEVTIADDRVWIRYAPFFNRPLRLTPREGLSLLVAGQAILAVSGADDAAGPLQSALTKLGAALGGQALAIQLGTAPEETIAVVRRSIAESRCVRLDYYSYGRDERRERVVEPAHLFADDGEWYVSGHCRHAGAERVFRVDRIRGATLLDEHFTPRGARAAVPVTEPAVALPRVTLSLAPDAAWVPDHYPHDSVVTGEDGRLLVTLPVTAPAWLDRLLVGLGPSAVVVDAPEGLGDARRAAAARRILARYSGA